MSEPARWSESELQAHMSRMRGDEPKPEAKRSFAPRGRKMNKTEAAYEAFLAQQQAAGEVVRYRYESFTLLLADGCRYTPDFMVYIPEYWITSGSSWINRRIEFHEIKGTRKRKSGIVGPHLEDDARVKLLTAAKLYPEFVFKLCWLDKGCWQIETIQGGK